MNWRGKRALVAGLCALLATVLAGAALRAGDAPTSGKVTAFAQEATPASRVSPRMKPTRPRGITAASSAVAAARAWLSQNRQVLAGTPVSALKVSRTSPGAAAGQTIVRFDEVRDGAVVLGGQAVLAVDKNRAIVAASAETLQGAVPSAEPRIPAAQAKVLAIRSVSGAGDRAAMSETSPRKAIYDPRILGGPGRPGGRLVWSVVVSRDEGAPLRRQVLVDASTGEIALAIDMLQTALNRRVCDANSKASQVPCTTAIRTEGGAAASLADANNAYDYAGKTWAFFSALGRDSIDGNGMRIDSTVRYCPSSNNCPYANAYWNGSQMVYGAGYASADDVVAHELAHGVTQYESNLFYYYQSGAINEALSDIFGELVDQTDGVGTDTTQVKWKIGEDLPGGAIRDMSNPPAFNDPDRMGSNLYAADTKGSDSGGVHTNSGVANKAASLIVDGGTFNGVSVAGMGVTKASRIWYQAALLLRSASDYSDLAVTLPQACRSIVGTASVTEADCAEVDKAVAGTEMATPPANAPNIKPVACTANAPVTSWSENFDGPVSARWNKRTISGAANWFYSSDAGADGPYATSGANNLWADDSVNRSDAAIEMPSGVVVPAGSKLYFKHAFGFEQQDPGYAGAGDTGNYDGGVVEYSVNNGVSWADAGSLMDAGGYGGALTTASDSPLAGRQAFVGQSRGYVATRLDLSSLAGKTVRFRFRMATDTANDNWSWSTNGASKGWFVDDVSIYACGVVPPPDTTPPDTAITAGPSGLGTSTTAAFQFTSTEAGSTFECSLDSGAYAACSSPITFTGLGEGAHSFAVRAVDAAGNRDSTPAARSFTVDSIAPDTTVVSGPSGPIAATLAAFAFSSPDSGVTFECSLDSGAFATCTTPRAYTNLSQGAHSFAVRARDAAGNVDASPATRTFVVDTIAPDTAIASGPSGWLSSTTAVFTFNSNEQGAGFQCSIDGGQYSSCVSPRVAAALSQGSHVFRVRSVDRAGNIDATPATRSLAVDTIAPDTRIVSGPTATMSTKPVYAFGSPQADRAYFLCAFDSGPWVRCASPWAPAVALSKGTHVFRVRAVDFAGNADPSPALRTVKIGVASLSASGRCAAVPQVDSPGLEQQARDDCSN